MKSNHEMSDEVLLSILSGRHYNMLERKEMQIWPHAPIQFSRCIEVIKNFIMVHNYFPRKYSVSKSGANVGDVMAIEMEDSGTFVLHAHTASQYNLSVIAEESHNAYKTAEEAISEYLKWEFTLPGDLDGWKVIQ